MINKIKDISNSTYKILDTFTSSKSSLLLFNYNGNFKDKINTNINMNNYNNLDIIIKIDLIDKPVWIITINENNEIIKYYAQDYPYNKISFRSILDKLLKYMYYEFNLILYLPLSSTNIYSVNYTVSYRNINEVLIDIIKEYNKSIKYDNMILYCKYLLDKNN